MDVGLLKLPALELQEKNHRPDGKMQRGGH
jgi:hypothetical protein